MKAALIGAPSTVWGRVARTGALILIGSCLMAAAAHIQVPFWPVKLSMQTFTAILIGFAYGSRLGGVTIFAYIVEGSLGLPVFQSGAGLVYLAGPTGGYLFGFMVAAVAAGTFAESGALRRIWTAVLAVLLSISLIYVPGVAWLGVLFGFDKAIAFGLTSFIPGEALKILLLIALVPAINRFRTTMFRA